MALSRAVLRPAFGFALILLLVLSLAVIANHAFRQIHQSEQLVTGEIMEEVVAVEQLARAVDTRAAASTAFALTGDHGFLEEIGAARTRFDDALDRLQKLADSNEQREALLRISRLDARLRQESDRIRQLIENGQIDDARAQYQTTLAPMRERLVRQLEALRRSTRSRAEVAHGHFLAELARQRMLVTVFTAGALLIAAAIAFTSAYLAVRAEKRLERAYHSADASEKSLSALLAASPDYILLVDRDQRVRFASLSILKAIGKRAESVHGTRLVDHAFLGGAQADFTERLGAVVTGGGAHRFEGWCDTVSGRKYLEFIFSPIYEEGRITAAVITARDLTDRLQMEARLRESNHRVASILESISDAFVSLDNEWRYTYVNREAERLFGMPRHELEGRNMWEAFPEMAGTALEASYRTAMEKQEPVELEELFAPIGRWLEIHAYPSPIGLSVYFRDITDRKKRERQQRLLSDATAHLGETLDYEMTLRRITEMAVPELADASALWIRENGGFRFIGRDVDLEKQEVMYRITREFPLDLSNPRGLGSVLKHGRSELIQGVDAEFLMRIAGTIPQFRLLRSLELRCLLAVPIRGREGVVGILGLATRGPHRCLDQSDLSIAQELAERAAFAVDNARLYREAQDAARAREELLAVVSHDLRNPLSHILLLSSQLLRTGEKTMNAGAHKKIESVRRSAEQMRSLISDLLDLASAQAHKLSLKRSGWQVSRIFEDARDAFEPLAAERGIHLRFEDRTGDLLVDCDRARVLQVLSNLVGNAIRFSPEGGTITLAAEASEDRTRVLFSVCDQGPGIAPDVLPRLFERFWSGGAAQKGGTGLGLFIVKNIVEDHGGRVWADTEEGKGSRFRFELPVAQELRAEPPSLPH